MSEFQDLKAGDEVVLLSGKFGDVVLAVKNVYVDGWTGGYCARFADGSWGRVENLLRKGQLV